LVQIPFDAPGSDWGPLCKFAAMPLALFMVMMFMMVAMTLHTGHHVMG
jgi:hypothetical protein